MAGEYGQKKFMLPERVWQRGLLVPGIVERALSGIWAFDWVDAKMQVRAEMWRSAGYKMFTGSLLPVRR